MNEELKERLIDGTFDRAEEQKLAAEIAGNPALADELAAQFELDSVLGELHSTPNADARVLCSVLAELRTGRAGETNAVDKSPSRWWAAAASIALLAGLGIGGLAGRNPGDAIGKPVAAALTWSERLAAADAAQMPGLFREIYAQPPGPQRTRAIQLAMYRWPELDAAGALEFLQDEASGDQSALASLFEALVRIDSDGAWSAARALNPPGRRATATRVVLGEFAETAPERFMALAAEAPESARPGWRRAFRHLASRGELSGGSFDALPKDARDYAIAGAAEGLATRDLASALVWARTWKDEEEREGALARILPALALVDPAAAGRELTQAGTPPHVASALALDLAERDPSAALKWVQEFGGALRPQLYRELALEMVRQGDSRAVPFLASLVRSEGPGVFRKDHRLDNVFWQARGLDYPGAVTWVLDEVPRSAFGWNGMLRGLIFSWAKDDLAGVERWIEVNAGGSPEREIAKSVVAWQMLSTSVDYDRVWAYVNGWAPGADRARMLGEIIRREAAFEPAAAARRLTDLPADADRMKALELVSASWADYAPHEAITWASSLPERDRSTAFQAIAAQWSKHDSDAVARWLRSLPDDKDQDSATQALVARVAPFDAAPAFAWALSMHDRTARIRTAETAVREWNAQDAPAARAAVLNTALPAEEKARLINAAQPQ